MAAGVNKRNISIVLNKPKYPGNIGSVARCAANTGIGKIVVVNCENPDQDKIRQMATHLAAGTVERIRFTDSLEEALSGFHYIVGTTSRLGGARSASLYPREIAAELVDLSQHNEIALLFGPEDFGLTNEELKHCNCLVTIPTSEDLKSINLSHAVMILCYEIFLAGQDGKRTFTPRLASSRELEGMYGQLTGVLTRIGFINPENPDYWMMNLRRFLSRVRLYSKEVQIIRGICRQIDWYGRNKKT
jgi:tRNA/rRNA methyltransferase